MSISRMSISIYVVSLYAIRSKTEWLLGCGIEGIDSRCIPNVYNLLMSILVLYDYYLHGKDLLHFGK